MTMVKVNSNVLKKWSGMGCLSNYWKSSGALENNTFLHPIKANFLFFS